MNRRIDQLSMGTNYECYEFTNLRKGRIHNFSSVGIQQISLQVSFSFGEGQDEAQKKKFVVYPQNQV